MKIRHPMTLRHPVIMPQPTLYVYTSIVRVQVLGAVAACHELGVALGGFDASACRLDTSLALRLSLVQCLSRPCSARARKRALAAASRRYTSFVACVCVCTKVNLSARSLFYKVTKKTRSQTFEILHLCARRSPGIYAPELQQCVQQCV